MKKNLDKLAEVKILVVGDLMVDTYLWGEVDRVSPEAPVPVVRVAREEKRLGGAANVVNNLVALGCSVGVGGVVGLDALGEEVRAMLKKRGVNAQGVVGDAARPTIEKTRVMGRNQQILRFDRELTTPLSSESTDALKKYLSEVVGQYHGVIVSDYGKGLVEKTLMAHLINLCDINEIPLVVDPKGSHYGKYKGVTCITPNELEAATVTRNSINDDDMALAAAQALQKELGLPSLCITRGARGVLALHGNEHHFLPARAREVYDVTGAGDTFISVLGAMMGLKADFFEAVETANYAAGVVVGKVGTATITAREILAASEGTPKIYSFSEIKEAAEELKNTGKKIVFTNGCFDLLHTGHVQYLQASRKLGDVLIVGINSDDSVKRLKGPERPVINEEDRAHMLAAIAAVDYVVIFPEDTPLNLIDSVQPDILTKGADYTVEQVVGHELLKKWGGEVKLIDLVENRSTSNLIQRIRENDPA